MDHKPIPPRSVGIIMDGNRRWAEEKGYPREQGHEAGLEKAKEVLTCARELGIEYVILYAFSTENWKRSPDEREAIFSLVEKLCAEHREQEEGELKNIKVRFIGEHDNLPTPLQNKMKQAEETTVEGNKDPFTVIIALSYGGRKEIVRAAQQAAESGRSIDEEALSSYLDTAPYPDPDLIIRTGGEKRISNFLLWQIAYAELFFTDTLWPAFSRREFEEMLEEFRRRTRKYGQ